MSFRVESLILKAYGLQRHQVIGLPDWAVQQPGSSAGQYYEVEAIAPFENPTRAQLQSMLQALLMERFQLRAHREMRAIPIYELRVAKNGPKFQSIAEEPKLATSTIFMLIQLITRYADRAIVDHTELAGYYEFPHLDQIRLNRPESAGALSSLLREYLGLELRAATETSEVLVIDQIEKPSAN
jgi:hypothetical protein